MTKKKKKEATKAKLKRGTKVLQVELPAYTKSAILQANTRLEWSGYGPSTHDGNGTYKLLDFYYLSSNDSGGETNLTPEALAQAWMNVVESGIDLDGVQLAWVHCHPGGGGFWSGTDEMAIKNLTERNGAGLTQLSVLFHGPGVMARLDEDGQKGESLQVEVDYGPYGAEIAKATELEKAYFARLDRADKATAKARKKREVDEQLVTLPMFRGTLPWFLDDTGEDYGSWLARGCPEDIEDEETVRWEFVCEMCGENREQYRRPATCKSCGGKMCLDCKDIKYPNVCKVCVIDVSNVDQMAKRLGPVGFCHLCEDPIQRGEMYCATCRPLFQDAEGEVGRYC